MNSSYDLTASGFKNMEMKIIKNIKCLLGVILSMIYTSCIDTIDLDIPAGEEKIVIEGLITNEPGPYQVKISRSTPVFEDPDNQLAPAILGAKVTISDDAGFETKLVEVEPGVYQTNDINFVGEIGKSYSLTAIINEKTYKSTTEVLNPVPDLQDLYFEIREEKYVNENNVELSRHFFDIYVDLMNNTDEPQYIRFDWRGVYEFDTNPKARSRPFGLSYIPDPPLCSGYIYNEEDGVLEQIAACECCTCWGKVFSSTVVADQVSPGNTKKRLRIASIFIDPFHFQKRFQVKVHHYSVSERAYNFWNLIEEQQNISGGIFDAPQGKLRGNISNTDNSEEEVLGYFGASSVVESSVFINKSTDVKINIEQINTFLLTFPCNEWDAPNSTTERPSDW